MHDQTTRTRRLVPLRDALLEVTTSGTFDVTLLAEGVIARRAYVDEPAQAATIIQAWQGPLTDLRARYSVRKTS